MYKAVFSLNGATSQSDSFKQIIAVRVLFEFFLMQMVTQFVNRAKDYREALNTPST